MPLTLKKQRDGKLRKNWYGEYTDANGKRRVVNLNVPWHGTPPASLKVADIGDTNFENSRETAQAELDDFVQDARRKGRSQHLVERLIEEKSGDTPEYVLLEDIPSHWLIGKTLNKGYVRQCKAIFTRFLLFMEKRNIKAKYVYQVKSSDALTYAKVIQDKFSPATFKVHIGILKSVFEQCLPEGSSNPFRNVKRETRKSRGAKEAGTIHRKPFTTEELFKLLEVSRKNTFMYPLIVAAACTGMRRGDVCQLRWSDIDMDEGIVAVKTSKTTASVEIPLFNPLREVLNNCERNGNEFVFPEAEHMYRVNESGLSYRFKKLVAEALDLQMAEALAKITPPAEIESEGMATIQSNVPEGQRRERMKEILRRYCAGATFKQISKDTGISLSTISADLHAIEEWIGKRFVKSVRGHNFKSAIERSTRVKREQGVLSASIRDWHALRTTFVTLALSANIPVELVKCVTGHTTVDVVLRHYFKPGREAFKNAFTSALPEVLTGVKALPPPSNTNISNPDNPITTEMDALLEKIKSGAANESDKARFRELAAQV